MTLIERVLIIGSVVGALITTTCYNVRISRCTIMESPCLTCSRQIMTVKELREDTLNALNTEMMRISSKITRDSVEIQPNTNV